MLTPQQVAGRVDPGRLPAHPILLASLPALFLFAENAVQQVTFDPLWTPLGISLGIGLVVLGVSSLLLRDLARGALLASLWLILFFGFGHAWNLVGGVLPGRAVLAGVVAGIGLLGSLAIWRGGRWVRPAGQFANIAVGLLVAFNLVRLGTFAVGAAAAGEPGTLPPIDVTEPDDPPDIYYIILDRYANRATLEEVFDHDNRPFLAELQARGFSVADDSWANYFKTAHSLASSLSMDYLDGDALRDGEPATFGPIFSTLRGHLPVPQTLTSLGYEYVHLGNYWEPTATNVDADRVLRYEEGSEFSAALWSTTAWSLLFPPAPPDDDPETIQLDQDARGHALFAFEALEDAAGRPGPTYVFAHILVPHPPYVFDADGSLPTPEEREERTSNEEYVRQLEWTNARVLAAIDRLQDVPAGDEPVIILQADEGPFPPAFAANEKRFDWLEATDGEIAQKFGILNALSLPGADADELGVHDRLSPVNAFRIVFNAYFGAELPLLPDRVFLSPDYDHMYDFTAYERRE
jgi:hypothetical protein